MMTTSVWPESGALDVLIKAEPSLKVLLVVAHPDDESECAATLYRITHEWGGTVDQVVVTNGQAGHQYSAPARLFYGISRDQSKWERELIRIRRRELLRAGRILGVRHHYLLGQKDTGRTIDIQDGFDAWNVDQVRRDLLELVKYGNYDLVLTLLPVPGTHGHHQTVAVLALEAIEQLPPQQRPAVLGVQALAAGESIPRDFSGLADYPVTRIASREPIWSFNRNTPMTCHPALNYSIVVNWMAAEHKSQGMFQIECIRRTDEHFWLFEAGGEAGSARWLHFLDVVETAIPPCHDQAAIQH